MHLLDSNDKRNLQAYQYSGGDSSPIYKYVLSPFAQFCVDKLTPYWLAPNVITLLGLSASMLSCLATIILDPDLTGSGPRWLYLLSGICVFSYQTLDNMDGKQARRTNSSSALGMLFDHGCDAINAGVTCIPMASAVATGWTIKIYLCLWGGYFSFYFQTWEEYYTGTMILPPFNGPTEGLLMSVGVCLISFIKGAGWWQDVVLEIPILSLAKEHSVAGERILETYLPGTSVLRLTPYMFILCFTLFAASRIAIKQVIDVICYVRAAKGSVAKAVVDLLPFLVFFPCLLYWCASSEIALKKYPLVTFLFLTSTFVDMLVHMMLSHICKETLKPFERYAAFFSVLLPLVSSMTSGSGNNYIKQSVDLETSLLIILTLYSFTKTSLLLYQMCTEVAAELGITIFTIKPKIN